MRNSRDRWTAARRVSIALSTMVVLLAVSMPVLAVPANGKVWTFTQPDGHQFQAVLRGDEFHAYHETPTGEILLQDPKTGFWHYAKPHADGTLEDTNIVVGQSAPETAALNPEKVPYLRAVQAMVSQKMAERLLDRAPVRVPAHGALKALILLANFSDTVPTFTVAMANAPATNITNSAATLNGDLTFAPTDFSNLMNTPGYNLNGAHGSVRDYYLEVSYGALTIQTDVYGWFNLPHPMAYYGANDPATGQDIRPREMIQDTITAAESTVDFSQYDSDGDGWIDFFGVIHQGDGEESGAPADCIWSHSWALASPMTVNGVQIQNYHTEPETAFGQLSTIGVNCHEMGHVFGLPDLYDTNYTSNGVGMWSIMAAGSWAGPGGNGSKPVHFDPWCKAAMGWITPTVVTSIQAAAALPAFWQNANSVLRIPVDPYNDGEYFLVANRYAFNSGQPATGFDQYLPGSGALVLHVDDYIPGNDNVTHKKVDVEEADGLAQLDNTVNEGNAGDLYPIGGTAFNDFSNPNSRDYAGNLTGIALTNFTGAGSANMAVDITPRASTGDSIVYDEMGSMGDSLGYDDGGDDFGLVRFTAPADVSIRRIKTFFVYSGTTNYTVRIYSGLSAGQPTGQLAMQTGAHTGAGTGSLTLSTPLSVSAGADFYVEIEYNTGGGYGWPIPFTKDTTPEERGYTRTSASSAYTQILVADGWPQDINIRVDYLSVAFVAPTGGTNPSVHIYWGAADGGTTTSSWTNDAALGTLTGGTNPSVHIYWGATDGGTTAGNWANDVALGTLAAGAFSTDIAGLNAGGTYYFRAYAQNSAGGVWAPSSANLVTDATVTAPAVADAPATSVTATAATLNGIVTGMGGENPTVHFYWGLTDGGTTTGSWANDANLGTHGLGAFSTNVSALTTSATYYYRAYAANSAGTAWAAASESFVTRDLIPATVDNAAATSITRTTAVLNGVVTATGGVTPDITLFYGTSDGGTTAGSWGSSVDVGLVNGGPFSATVTGLVADTPYYFRARAVNSIGTSWAPAAMAFTTLPNPLVTPTGLTASKGTFADHVAVSWPAVTGATHYKVFWAYSATDTPQELTGWIAATNYDDVDVAVGEVYYYWVQAARGAAGEGATTYSNNDSGWIGMTGPVANFKITYKNCTLSVVNNSRVQVNNALLASIKIDKLKNLPARATSIPGKVTYIVGSTGIPRLDVSGSISKFSSSAPIGALHVTGTITSLSTKGVCISTISAGALGSVKMSAYAKSDSENKLALTTIHTGDISTSGTLAAGAPALKIALTGVGLRELRAPQQAASIALASKKWRNPNGASDLSLASVPYDTDNVVEAGSLIQLVTKGGAIQPARILGSAQVNDSSLISATGLLFSGAAGSAIYEGTVAPGEIASGASQLTVLATAGNVRCSRILAAGEIPLLSAEHKMFRSGGTVTYSGGEVGLAETSGTMHVVSGIYPSRTNADILQVKGSVSVRGDFYAGGDGTLGTLYSAALGEVTTDKPGNYPANPTIGGAGWSSQPIRFSGGNHSTFVEHYP